MKISFNLIFSRMFFLSVLLFLYTPLFVIVIYSFNESRLMTVWTGFSTKWYQSVFSNDALMSAFFMSIKIAFFSALLSVLLGTLAAYAMIRFRKFRGKNLFRSLLNAPLVMPDVITGVSLLLVFVSFNQWFGIPSERGFTTVWIAHSLLCTAYVAVVVGVRLNEMDPAMEEAALDLGATPFYAFTRITLPIISPSLFAGGLLAFSLSLDDLVIASFTTGPGGTTLPMAVFSSIRRGLSPEVNVIMTLFLAIVAIVSFAAWFMMRQKIKKPWS